MEDTSSWLVDERRNEGTKEERLYRVICSRGEFFRASKMISMLDLLENYSNDGGNGVG